MKEVRLWFIFSILTLAGSGLFAFLIAMSRTPFGYKYFPADYFHYALVGHVDLSIVLWLLGFTIVLWNKFFLPQREGFSLSLSFAGFGLLFLSVLFGLGKPVPNNYIPVLDHPLFYGGLLFFFLGVLVNVLKFFPQAVEGLTSPEGIKGGLSTGVLLGFLMILSFPLSFFRSGTTEDIPLFFERLFWIPGHIQQFLYGAILIATWYYLLSLVSGKEREEIGALRFVNISFPLFSILLLSVLIFYPDPLVKEARFFVLLSFSIGLGIPIFMHIYYILRKIRFINSIACVSLIFSLILYLLGAVIAYLGLKSEDLRIPAHYHGAITSLTMALMGLSYYLLKDFGYKPVRERIAKVQSYIFGFGMTFFVIGLYLAGKGGAPRKTFGISFTDDMGVLVGLYIMGFGSILAVVGGVLFIFNVLVSISRKSRD